MDLYVTYCSGAKRDGTYPPDLLYQSDRISRFIDNCNSQHLRWAIFSALYGFFFPNETKQNYDVTFKTKDQYWMGISVIINGHRLSHNESRQHIQNLAGTLRDQAASHRVDRIIFYGTAPKMMKCYIGVLHYAFDGCMDLHGWKDLINHVEAQSKMIRIVHSIKNI
jgi:hypothetical protein